MEALDLVFITLGINLSCILLGFIWSVVHLYTPLFKAYQLQERKVSTKIFWQRLPLIGFNIALLQVLSGLGVYQAYAWFDQSWSWTALGLQFVVILLVDDFFFYWFHRLMHEWEWLFQRIHRIHHKASAPFPLEFIYVHPLEWMLGGLGVVLGFVVLVLGWGSVNFYAFCLYIFYRSAHEIEIHSGLGGRFLSKWLPFYGTVKHHDDHHALVRGNYASSLTYLDKLFKTEFSAEAKVKN